jgi:hypothetical protein
MSATDVFSRFSRESQEAIRRAGLWAHADGAMAIDVRHLSRALEPGNPPSTSAVALWTPQAKRTLELSLRNSLSRQRNKVELSDLRKATLSQSSNANPLDSNDKWATQSESDASGSMGLSAPEVISVADTEAVTPLVQDGSGYCIRKRDLEFLAISTEQLADWSRRAYPLGMSPITYSAFKDALREALLCDGLSIADCDVRLKGSASEFFSGPHKLLPRTKRDVTECFFHARRRTPDPSELDEIIDRLERRWLSDGVGPRRRPFESMHRLGISQYRSDLDVQISSDELVARCTDLLAREGQAAVKIAADYHLVPLPPGVLALGALSEPSTGACRALLDESDCSHEQLLELVQSEILEVDLEDFKPGKLTERRTRLVDRLSRRKPTGPPASVRSHDWITEAPGALDVLAGALEASKTDDRLRELLTSMLLESDRISALGRQLCEVPDVPAAEVRASAERRFGVSPPDLSALIVAAVLSGSERVTEALRQLALTPHELAAQVADHRLRDEGESDVVSSPTIRFTMLNALFGVLASLLVIRASFGDGGHWWRLFFLWLVWMGHPPVWSSWERRHRGRAGRVRLADRRRDTADWDFCRRGTSAR